jgi:signal transduction histidine kinase
MISLRSASINNDIMIEIQDNGNGIQEGLLPTIFEAYVSTKALNGTGLGLYMGKLVVEEHFSGTISVRNCSEFNPCLHSLSGACFTILIPVTQD